MTELLINALADVLDVDLNDLQSMSKAEQLQHLELLQADAVLAV